jgi:16S rRNA (guanine1207-N2)-methyltransferase
VSPASRALVHAFETGALAPQRAFFLRAKLAPFKDIDAEQSFRPEYLRLRKAGTDRLPAHFQGVT